MHTITEMLENPEKMQVMGKNARKRVLNSLTWGHTVEKILQAIGLKN